MSSFGSMGILTEKDLKDTLGGGSTVLYPQEGGGGGGIGFLKTSDLPGPSGRPYYGNANKYRLAGRHYATN